MCPPDSNPSNKLWRRRDLLKAIGATAIAGPLVLHTLRSKAATSKVIKIGHVSPQTGALAPFAEADPFILEQVRAVLAKGLSNGGVTYQVEIISKDSQSKTNRASEVAADLILKDKVDLLVASSTPETTNPVADQAEANEVPCITSITPWQPYYWDSKMLSLRSSRFGSQSRLTKSSAAYSPTMEMETPGATPKSVSRPHCRKPAIS
jgi:ABC-type sugar transport system substrate-binding protein